MTGGHIHNLKGRRYVPDRPVKILDRRRTQFSDLYWKVEVNGSVWHVARTMGKAVRIMFKPRGQNIGHHWHGAVRDDKGRDVWTARVTKSTGPLAMLHDAGLINWQWEVDAIEQKERCLQAEADAETASMEELEAAEAVLKRAEVEQRITDILDGI